MGNFLVHVNRMKIVKYIGGLGNQMFGYAFSYLLQKTFGETIYADVQYYKDHKFHNGLEIEHIFGIKLQRAKVRDIVRMAWYFPNYYIDYHLRRHLPNRKNQYYEPLGGVYTPETLKDVKDRYYYGYWQDHKYYDGLRDDLRKVFTFKEPLAGQNLKAFADMRESDNSVGIHIRRGDYINHPVYKDICTYDYYEKAITLIKERIPAPVFYIFSNDILWCKENIEKLLANCKVVYVDWNRAEGSYRDMQLMMACKTLVIANSSFSWWAAYLNARDAWVIAPDKWNNKRETFRYQLDEWTTI